MVNKFGVLGKGNVLLNIELGFFRHLLSIRVRFKS